MISCTADTNIYISGLHFGGQPRRFLSFAEARLFRLAVSEEILAEVAKVLAYEKFGWRPNRIQQAIRELKLIADLVKPNEAINAVPEDPPDNRILECALEAKSQYLVTGDQHLLRLERYDRIQILKLADFLKIVQEFNTAFRIN